MTATKQNTAQEYPLSDLAYDVIAILHRKSKSLAAFDKYLQDVQEDTQLRQALIEIRHDEHRHVEKLKSHLGRLIGTTQV
jgi:hypothetical protein